MHRHQAGLWKKVLEKADISDAMTIDEHDSSYITNGVAGRTGQSGSSKSWFFSKYMHWMQSCPFIKYKQTTIV